MHKIPIIEMNPNFSLKIGRELFQAHLKRISDFLSPGYGVWWKTIGEQIIFHDGDNEPDWREEGEILQQPTCIQQLTYLFLILQIFMFYQKFYLNL